MPSVQDAPRGIGCGAGARRLPPQAVRGARNLRYFAANYQDPRTKEKQVKKILENMIIKWHRAGYSLDEIAPLMPQVPKAAIAAIIHQHDKETRL